MAQQVVRFSGSSEHVDFGVVGAVQFERTDAFSVAFWFRALEPEDAFRALVACMDASSVGWAIRLVSSSHGSSTAGVLQVLLAGSTESRDVYWPTAALDDQLWHHVVITSDGVDAAGISIYVDGVEASTTAVDTLSTETIIGTSPQLTLAALEPASSNYFRGQLTRVAVWSVELSASQAEEAWQGGRLVDYSTHSASASLVINTEFDTDTYPTLVDEEGTANGTMASMEARDLVDDRPPECSTSVAFDGSDDLAIVASFSAYNFERTDTFSASVWFRTIESGTAVLLDKSTTTPDQGWLVFIAPHGGVEGRLNFSVRADYGGSDAMQVASTNAYNDGEWHHVVVTYDGSSAAAGAAMYVDGVAETLITDMDTLSSSIQNSEYFSVGNRESSFIFNGLMTEAAVYDKELTSGEASTIYGGGTPPHLRASGMPSNLVGYWKLGDWDSFGTLRDMSGVNTNDLVTTGMTAASLVYAVPPAAKTTAAVNSLQFGVSSINNSVEPADSALLDFIHTDVYSIVAWVKIVVTQSSTYDIIVATSRFKNNYAGMQFFINDNWDDKFIEFLIVGTGESDSDKLHVRWDHKLTQGEWHQLAVTYDGSTAASGVQLYIDGEPVVADVVVDTLTTSSSSAYPFRIGANQNNGDVLHGSVADVQVYKGLVLDSYDIKELFNARVIGNPLRSPVSGWLVGWYRMGDFDTLPDIEDYSPRKNDATGTSFSTSDIQGDVPAPFAFPTYMSYFDGETTACVLDSVKPELDLGRSDTFSLGFWYMGTSSDSYNPIMSTINGSDVGWEISLNNPGLVSFMLVNVPVANQLHVVNSSGPAVNDGNLHFVLVTYDGSSSASGVRMYIDGSEVSLSVTADTISGGISSSEPMTIGRRPPFDLYDSGYLIGNLSFCTVYDRVLTPAEVLLMYNSGNGTDHGALVSAASLVSWWRLDLQDTNMPELSDSAARYDNRGDTEFLSYFEGEFTDELIMPVGGTTGGGTLVTYAMRALQDPGPGYHHWTVTGAPDLVGDDAPGDIIPGSAIVVNSWGRLDVTV